MKVDFETFMLTQEDHLVPRAKGGSNGLENRVIACYVCNNLKGFFVPEFELTATNRTAYIDAVRDHIMSKRSEKMRDFATWTHLPGGVPRESPE